MTTSWQVKKQMYIDDMIQHYGEQPEYYFDFDDALEESDSEEEFKEWFISRYEDKMRDIAYNYFEEERVKFNYYLDEVAEEIAERIYTKYMYSFK